jgi:hypothetical protein
LIDHHTVAAISIAGSALDFFGGMYLAYDLLGGQHGPLRTLTRGLTYSLLCTLGFAIFLGWRFALPVGITTGFTVAIELARAARNQPNPGLFADATFSAIRGIGFAAGLYPTFGLRFAICFAVLSTAGQTFAYSRGIRPTLDYESSRRLRLTRRHFLAALNRTLWNSVAALICSWIAHSHLHSWTVAVRYGAVIGLVTAFIGIFGPPIEYFADSLPERRLGVFGVALILCGFMLQSVQYWVNLLDIPVR